jgi:hypothetical protein
MCIRCLERLYSIHAKKIGPFEDSILIVRYMSSTKSIETQHRLLGLLAAILGVSQSDDHDKNEYDATAIPENAEQLLNVESISQLCQFVAWGHTSGDQIGNVLARSLGSDKFVMLTNGIDSGVRESLPNIIISNDVSCTDSSPNDKACPPLWFVAATGRIPPPPDVIKGPFRVSDLVQMMEVGDLTPYDLVTVSYVEEYDIDDINSTSGVVKEDRVDTGKWKRLNQVWQLRWQLCTDRTKSGIYSPSEVALLAIKALIQLVDLHHSLDSRGVPYFPIPTAKRILCQPSRDTSHNKSLESGQSHTVMTSPLSAICQSLLCNDPKIVDEGAQLVLKLTQYNPPAMTKLYLTGVFFFASCYTGSNYRSIASLLAATHANQLFRSGFAATADVNQVPIQERSILGNILPEGLLAVLDNYGPDRFASVFVGNIDTPEVIWTFEMRKHLIEMVRQHLGEFPLRLVQNTSTEYEYCPMPGVSYKRLESEFFCHNYYLHNLCDEVRFPDWPIAEPVEVFRACLERFKMQFDRNTRKEEEVFEKARKCLDLQPGDGSKELRKAYRNLARKYHPDKVRSFVLLLSLSCSVIFSQFSTACQRILLGEIFSKQFNRLTKR